MKKTCIIACVLCSFVLLLGCPSGAEFFKENSSSGNGLLSKLRGLGVKIKKGGSEMLQKRSTILSGEPRILPVESMILSEEAYAALLESLERLKESLSYKPECFDEFQFYSMFNKFWHSPPQVSPRTEHVYASVKRDIKTLGHLRAVIEMLAGSGRPVDLNTASEGVNLIAAYDLFKKGENWNLASDVFKQGVNWGAASDLLSNLNNSIQYVIQVFNDENEILSKDNLTLLKSVDNEAGITELKDMLDRMLLVRNEIIEKVKIVLQGAAGLATMQGAALGVSLHINKFINKPGFIYDRIYSTSEPILGLQGLRNAIRKQVNKLLHKPAPW
ncbi:hypothetical protein [Borrelia hermsii]|uniref:Lipoprotein n=2 Tax=Borrelia hermsii TaxID=140 RepID=T1EC87_BORHE|nr:hypothetical protein [Borrelia hermsii]ADN26296.1 hypothetical protein BHA044 [Borrelia hermsii]AMR75880.1 hypothetical protein A0V01_04520 [Borrelia hermsii]ANA43686.1 hypothetical protein AXX13_A0210 [Borrelia hermsii HS1]UCP01913.1 hypothetical protein K9R62_04570 [Borrelia hermsii]UPA08480.1 hypothetical protein bhDAH_001188 [Borrelia hermsii DAH]